MQDNIDLFSYLLGKSSSGGGGGGITVEKLTATENGTYTAESGKAFNPVVVDVASDDEITIISDMTNTEEAISVFNGFCTGDVPNVFILKKGKTPKIPNRATSIIAIKGNVSTGAVVRYPFRITNIVATAYDSIVFSGDIYTKKEINADEIL